MTDYKEKYLKYKLKYMDLQKLRGGGGVLQINAKKKK